MKVHTAGRGIVSSIFLPDSGRQPQHQRFMVSRPGVRVQPALHRAAALHLFTGDLDETMMDPCTCTCSYTPSHLVTSRQLSRPRLI